MKYITQAILGITVICFAIGLGGSTAQSEQHKQFSKHESVSIWANQSGISTPGKYQYAGAQVYASSSSQGAPTFPQADIPTTVQLVELGDAIALLLNEGFHIERASDNGQYFLFVK